MTDVSAWNMQITGEEPADQSGFHKVTAKGVNWNAYLDPGEYTHDIGFCAQNGLGKTGQPR